MTLLALTFKLAPVLTAVALVLIALDVGGVQQPAIDAYFALWGWLFEQLAAPAFDRIGSNAT